jgi:hypothetical protein
VVKRTSRKIKLTLDSTIVVTIEETVFDAKKAKVRKLLGAGMAIYDATIDRAKEDEREVEAMRRELENLRHHRLSITKNTTQVVIILRDEFLE